jgi:hypothetical protein
MAYSMCLVAAAEKVDELLQSGLPLSISCGSDRRPGNSRLGAIHHFLNFTVGTLSTGSTRGLMQREVMQLAFEVRQKAS